MMVRMWLLGSRCLGSNPGPSIRYLCSFGRLLSRALSAKAGLRMACTSHGFNDSVPVTCLDQCLAHGTAGVIAMGTTPEQSQ